VGTGVRVGAGVNVGADGGVLAVGPGAVVPGAAPAGVRAGVAVASFRTTSSSPGTEGGRISNQRARTAPPKSPNSAMRKIPREGAERSGSRQAPQ
jgi:hypothetical protein